MTEDAVHCVRCKQQFNPKDNVGVFGCRQHVLQYNRVGPGKHHGEDQFDCCGVSRSSTHPAYNQDSALGCTPCDHIHPQYRSPVDNSLPTIYYRYGEADSIVLSVERVFDAGLRFYERSVKIANDRRSVVIMRYDERLARMRMQYGRPYEEYVPELHKSVTRTYSGVTYYVFYALENPRVDFKKIQSRLTTE